MLYLIIKMPASWHVFADPVTVIGINNDDDVVLGLINYGLFCFVCRMDMVDIRTIQSSLLLSSPPSLSNEVAEYPIHDFFCVFG